MSFDKEENRLIQENLKPPSKRKYDTMIHELAVMYGISPREAETLEEWRFYQMVAEENLKVKRNEPKSATPGGTGG